MVYIYIIYIYILWWYKSQISMIWDGKSWGWTMGTCPNFNRNIFGSRTSISGNVIDRWERHVDMGEVPSRHLTHGINSYLFKPLPISDTLQKMTNSLLVNVDIPIDTKRLVRISLYPSKIDLVMCNFHVSSPDVWQLPAKITPWHPNGTLSHSWFS